MLNIHYLHLPDVDTNKCRAFLTNYHIIRDDALLEKMSPTRIASLWFRYVNLSQYLKCLPNQLQLAKEDSQRPVCLNRGIDFNISHSGDWLLMAVSSQRVGVDIEHIKLQRNIRAIAQRYFSQQECQDLYASDNFTKAFYQLWTLKEASVKYTGEGIAKGLKSHGFHLNKGQWKGDNSLYYHQNQMGGYMIAIVSKLKEIPQIYLF